MNNNQPKTQGDHTLYPVVAAVKQEDGSFLMQCVASGITLRQHFALEFAKSGKSEKEAVEAADVLIDELNVGCIELVTTPEIEPVTEENPVIISPSETD